MKRSVVNFTLDAAILFLLAGVISTGLIMGFLLPPGSGRLDVEAAGESRGDRPISLLWGWGRHDWGDLHFWLSMALIVAALIHLALHWRWIVAMVTRPMPGLTGVQRRRRVAVAVAGVFLVAGIIAMPWFMPIRSAPRAQLAQSESTATVTEPPSDIRGAMTLRDVEALTGMPVADLLEALDLPSTTPAEERLGRLRRRHGFAMSDVREAVDRWQAERVP